MLRNGLDSVSLLLSTSRAIVTAGGRCHLQHNLSGDGELPFTCTAPLDSAAPCAEVSLVSVECRAGSAVQQ